MRRRELLASAVKRGEGRDIYNNYEYVDLQLTGSAANLMFATCNVGASKETEDGNYYQWGAGSTTYQNTNQYHTGGTNTAYTLPMSADTARQVMGGKWRMPTSAECAALTAQTNYEFTTINGVAGGKFSKTVDGKERYVFFPAAGYYLSGSLYSKGSNGRVWGSTPSNSSKAYYLYFSSGGKGIYDYARSYGLSVRGVYNPNEPDENGRGVIDNYEYVDLGLPSKVKWATCNVGATAETAYGDYYKYGAGSTKYVFGNDSGFYSGNSATLPLSADTARQVMGGTWKMPTSAHCQELIDNTTSAWTRNNKVSGVTFTSKKNTNAKIFFPAGGYKYSSSSQVGIQCHYHTSSNVTGNSANSISFHCQTTKCFIYEYQLSFYGLLVRGVHT